jgi:Mrp family chromosome partitioning ATPase
MATSRAHGRTRRSTRSTTVDPSGNGSANNAGATEGGASDDGDQARSRDDGNDRGLPAVPGTHTDLPATALLRYDNIPNELAEGLRGIINRHELRTGERLPKSIAVTSPLSGEGVTTVSQALATIIAQEMGHFVCWVDCAWLTPDGAGDRQPGRPSLVDILADQSRVISAFQAAPDLPQLMSLSPGPVPESKRNMIVRSPEFERLLAILAEEFDYVVFDVPAVLTNANGLALLRRADASLLVVRHRSTTIAQVQRAIEATQPTPNIGTLLNRYRTSIPGRVRRLLGG